MALDIFEAGRARAANGCRHLFLAVSLIAAVACSSCSDACTMHDVWIGDDKNLHFASGVAMSLAATAYTGDPTTGFYLGAAAGAAKEIYDAFDARKCSLQDFVLSAAGAAAGAYLGHLYITRVRGGTVVGYAASF